MSESEKESVLDEDQTTRGQRVSRRFFLKSSSAAVASAGAVTIGAAAALDVCSALAQDATPGAAPAASPSTGDIPPVAMGDERAAQFFSIHEAETVDAIVSRILPGTTDDPGTHEAGVVFYIDRMLGGANLGYTLKTYTQGPFPVVSEEPVTVEAASTRDIYDYVLVPKEDIARYGYQSVMTPQEVYRRGLGFIDGAARSMFDTDFVDLTSDQQDQILTAMDDDKATGFEGPSGKAFFTRLRNDTIEGTFSDPMYGGNRDMVGWKLIGYPGAQRIYTADDIKNPTFQRPPQTLEMLIVKEGH